MYAQAYGGQAPSFFHREVYNLIMEAREILTKFKNNEISLEEAEHYFRKEPFEEMGEYAKLDLTEKYGTDFRKLFSAAGRRTSILYRSSGDCMRITEKSWGQELPAISTSW